MKKKHRIILMIIATVLVIIGGFNIYRKSINKDMLVIIDAGHGGDDPGTTGVSGVYEKDINLEIAKILERQLWKKGYKIEMIRNDDETIDVYERANRANQLEADLYISLHCNAIENNPEMNGVQVLYYPDEFGVNERLSRIMMDGVINATGAEDMRLEPREDLIVLSHTAMKTIMVEMGFLTNTLECDNLENRSYQKKMVKGIGKAIDQYHKQGLLK